METGRFKDLVFVGSSLDGLRAFPEDVRYVMGVALRAAQSGSKSDRAKPLRGFGDAGVPEVVDDHDGDTFRAVYPVRFTDVVYVLHAFQKKSKSGRSTPPKDVELIKSRLKLAAADFKERRSR